MIKPRLGGALAGIAFFFATVPNVAAQQDPCGDLPEFQCGLLETAVRNWNERFGETVNIKGWNYTGPINGDQALGLLSDPDKTWVPVADKEGNVIDAKKLNDIAPDAMTKWSETLSGALQGFIQSINHSAQLDWTTTDEAFTTTAIFGNAYPYMYDNMTSNVAIREATNSCAHERFYWLFEILRGEVYINLVPLNSDISLCKRVSTAWFHIGQNGAKQSDIKYSDGVCQTSYAWYVSTPYMNVGFDIKKFKFEISGIGTHVEESGDCVIQR